ncbi:MAG: hypothetical protein ABIH74_00930 [Candidatus Omnitrophota bacterium]
MRLYRFIFTGIMITAVAMGYVHQRVEIVKAGYGLQENRARLSGLVDRNSKLMYNLSKLESPKRLLAALSGEKVEFVRFNPEKMNASQSAFADSGAIADGSIIVKFLDLFTLNAEAQPREYSE